MRYDPNRCGLLTDGPSGRGRSTHRLPGASGTLDDAASTGWLCWPSTTSEDYWRKHYQQPLPGPFSVSGLVSGDPETSRVKGLRRRSRGVLVQRRLLSARRCDRLGPCWITAGRGDVFR